MATLIKGLEALIKEAPKSQNCDIVAIGARSRELLEGAFSLTQATSLTVYTHQSTGAAGWAKAELAGGKAKIEVLDIVTLIDKSRAGNMGVVVMQPNKDRELTNLWADCACAMLKQGGILIVVGAREEGIEPLEKRLAENMEQLGREILKPLGRGSVWRKTMPIPAPTLKWSHFEADKLTVKTLPGVFSKSHFDEGTKILLSAVEVGEGKRVLDLCCGPGTLGLTLLAKDPTLKLTLTDEDANAVASARKTAADKGLQPVEILLGDGTEAIKGDKFDVVLLNPPFHSGQTVSYMLAERLSAQAKGVMAAEAVMYMVANSHCPYEKFLKATFKTVEVVKGDAHYKVWRCA